MDNDEKGQDMIPNTLPTLSKGKHDPGEGKACVMEYVSLLAGEPWSDSPYCTHPVLARAAQVVNDRLPDDERHLLVPLIGRLFGTAQAGTEHEQKVLSVRLACWSARQVLDLSADRAVALRAIEAAEAWCEGRASVEEVWDDAHAAEAHVANAALAAAAANVAQATAYATLVTTYAYDDSDTPVEFLTDLLDEYDRLAGRTEHRHVSDDDLTNLREAVAAGAVR